MTSPSTAEDCACPGTRAGKRIVLCVVVALLLAACLEPVAQHAQSAKPNQHYQAARTALIGGNVDSAILEVKLALQDNPLDAASHFLMGCLLERSGETDQAIVGFERAVALDPTNPDALYNLGTLLLRREEAVAASGLLENAVLLRPDHVPSYSNLAKAYFQIGLPELSVAAYEEVLRRDSSNVVALRNLLVLATAAGHSEAANSYRRRLESVESGRAGGRAIEPVSSGGGLPAWPLAPGETGSRSLTSTPKIDVRETPSPADTEVDDLRDLLRDLPQVKAERRGGQLTLIGWTRTPWEKEMLTRILAGRKNVLDLTSDDVGDAQRMIELDAIIFVQYRIDQLSVGFNFLRLLQTNLAYFASDHTTDGTGFAAPGTIGAVTSAFQSGWLFSASIDYAVNIANATAQQVAVVARPHLTTLSGTPATFLAGGEIVFQVSGLNSGDIKLYPFGTTLKVTPTLLRTVGDDGTPRVRIAVEAGRTSALGLVEAFSTGEQVSFDKILVTSQSVVGLGQTLILSGLNQRESRTTRIGVPGLMYVPILKYLFSSKTTTQSDSAVIVFLTPRDPGLMDERNRTALTAFVEKRRAYLKARQGTQEDMRMFKQSHPDWNQIAPNRFASHFFLVSNSDLYRAVSGPDLGSEDLDLELLGPSPKKKKTTK